MKRCYIIKAEDTGIPVLSDLAGYPAFIEFDGIFVWALPGGAVQVICEESAKPAWLAAGEDIRTIDANPTKKAALSACYGPTIAKGTMGQGLDKDNKPCQVELPERKAPIPLVVLLGQTPEDFAKDEPILVGPEKVG